MTLSTETICNKLVVFALATVIIFEPSLVTPASPSALRSIGHRESWLACLASAVGIAVIAIATDTRCEITV